MERREGIHSAIHCARAVRSEQNFTCSLTTKYVDQGHAPIKMTSGVSYYRCTAACTYTCSRISLYDSLSNIPCSHNLLPELPLPPPHHGACLGTSSVVRVPHASPALTSNLRMATIQCQYSIEHTAIRAVVKYVRKSLLLLDLPAG